MAWNGSNCDIPSPLFDAPGKAGLAQSKPFIIVEEPRANLVSRGASTGLIYCSLCLGIYTLHGLVLVTIMSELPQSQNDASETTTKAMGLAWQLIKDHLL